MDRGRQRLEPLNLSPLSANTTGELNILGHDGHTFGVDSAQVCIFKESHKVCLGRFLEGENGGGLETEISLEILGNLTNETLEGSLTNEELRTLLVFTDLTEGDSSGAITMGLFLWEEKRRKMLII